jgi:hypothetical protein
VGCMLGEMCVEGCAMGCILGEMCVEGCAMGCILGKMHVLKGVLWAVNWVKCVC